MFIDKIRKETEAHLYNPRREKILVRADDREDGCRAMDSHGFWLSAEPGTIMEATILDWKMAELPHLGKQCHMDLCKQLDFLPFVCDHCQLVFCLEHRSPFSHNCILSDNQVPLELTTQIRDSLYSCVFAGCENKEVVPIVCEHCSRTFCLKHRHQQDHSCPVLSQKTDKKDSKTAELVKRITENVPPNPPRSRGRKSSATATKVRLMKMKLHAVGDSGIPQEERIYLRIMMPRCHSCNEKSYFFSQVWSVGKVVDDIATREKLVNNNNIPSAKQLCLFDGLSGSLLVMSESLKDLVKDEQIHSGDSVILEYCERGLLSLLDFHTYLKD